MKYRGPYAGRRGNWDTPRRTGYEHNWALSGATAGEVISGGQATGPAEQARQGLITDFVLHAGANDCAIWNGSSAAVEDTPSEGGLTTAQVRQ